MFLPDVRPRHPLVGPAICAVLGIAAADWWRVEFRWALAATGVLAVVCLAWPRTVWSWLLVASAFFTLHSERHHDSAARRLATSLPRQGSVVEVVGVVWTEPTPVREWAGNLTGFFDLRIESIAGREAEYPAGVVIAVAWCGPLPRYGDRVRVTGRLSNLTPVRNPGQFDFLTYRQRGGVFSELTSRYADDCRIESHGHGRVLISFAHEARAWIQSHLRRDLADEPEVATLIESMVLGLQGETPDDVRALFQKTGTLHLFAVSGLNIAMLAAIALHALKPFGLRRRLAVLLVIPLLGAYALVTGLSASCVRAAIMGAVVLAATLFERRPTVCNSLAAAALAILAWDTNQLFLPGFQFSFVLVLVIVLLALRLQRRCESLLRPDPFLPRSLWSAPLAGGFWCWRQFSAAVGVTLAAWIGSLAFSAGYFHLFSISALFANLLAVPLAFAVLLLGLGTALCGGLWPYGAELCSNANWLMAKSLLAVVRLFSAMPGGHQYVELPSRDPAAVCEMTVLDCGEGAAIHVRADGADWLIDTGSVRVAERTVIPYLRSRGVNRLDGLVLTHGDSKHLGGAPAILTELSPRVLLDSPLRDRSSTRRSLHAALAQSGRAKSIVLPGDRIVLGSSTRLRVLFPPSGRRGVVADDQALVLLLEAGSMRVLLLSDSGFSTERWLAEHEPELRCDIVVKGWHSKDLSGTPDFLARLGASAVISSAPDFGVRPESLDPWEGELRQRGVRVFRQEQCGAVAVALRSDTFTIRTTVDRQTFTSRAR